MKESNEIQSSIPSQEESSLDVLTHDFKTENTPTLKKDLRILKQEKEQIQQIKEQIKNTQELDKSFKEEYLPEHLLNMIMNTVAENGNSQEDMTQA